MFFGEGAGSLPAASAIVGDVIEVARHIQSGCLNIVGCTCREELPVREIGDLVTQYYVRLLVEDRPGVLAKVAQIFGENDVSLASVLQTRTDEHGGAEIVWVTHAAAERDVRAALDAIALLDVVREVASVIRVEEL